MAWGIAATLLGGFFGANNERRINSENIAASERADEKNRLAAIELNNQNIAEARRAEGVALANVMAAETRADTRRAVQRAEIIADRDEHREYTDPAATRARLEAAGFNPAAYFQDQSGAFVGGTAQGSAITPASTPLPSLGRSTARAVQVGAITGFSDAIGSIGQMLHQQSLLKQKNTMLTKQLDKATITPRVGDIYDRKRANKVHSSVASSIRTRSNDAGTNLVIGGIDVDRNDHWSDAEDVEQRIGDVGSAVYGLGVAGADAAFNNYLLKRRKEGVIDLDFLVDEYSRLGKRPRARPQKLTLSAPHVITQKTLAPSGPFREQHRMHNGPNVHWYR